MQTGPSKIRRFFVIMAMMGIFVLGGCGAPEGRTPNTLKVTGKGEGEVG